MEAMGLVPWVYARQIGADRSQTLKVEDVPVVQPQAELTTTQISTAVPIPAESDQLAHWLVLQPLLQLTYRGSTTHCIGSHSANLIVVCLQAAEPEQLPLNKECTQLFDLMMRAINIARTGYRQCAVSVKPAAAVGHIGAPVHLEDILASSTRGVLVLDPQLHDDAADSHSGKMLLPSSSLPLWRIPHPDLLLATPALKRVAWEKLKVIQQVLDN